MALFPCEPGIAADRLKVPESNDSSEIGQPIPASNRFVAALVDMMVVAMPTIVVALVLSERFSILDDANGRPRFSEPDQLRINEIDEGFNRAMRLGETVFTLSGSGWWLSLLVLIALTAFIFVVLPAKLGLRTPGQMLLSVPLVAAVEDRLETVIIVDDPLEIDKPSADHTLGAGSMRNGQGGESDLGAEMASSIDTTTAQEPGESMQESAGSTGSSSTMNPSQPSESQPFEIASPVTLGDTGDYLDWDREQATAAASIGAGRSTASSFDNLALTESSLAESDLNASTMVKAKASTPSAGTGTAATGTGTAESPIWSELWNAWLYWDPASDRWFRHDTDNNCWKPLK